MNRQHLHFRMISEGGEILSAATASEKLNAELTKVSLSFVHGIYAQLFPTSPAAPGMIPEILSEGTIDRICRLEVVAQDMRNMLAEMDETAGVASISDMIDRADAALED